MRNTGMSRRGISVRRGELAAAAPEGLPPGRGQGGGQAPSPNLLGVRGKGKGPAGPFPSLLGRCREGRSPPDSRGGKGRAKLAPTCTRPAAALKNCTIQDRVSPPERCRETRRFPDFIPQRRRVRREEQIPRRKIPFFGAEFASDIFRRVRRSRARRKMSLAESLCPLAGRDFQRRLAARPATQPVDAAIWMLNPPVNPSTSSISPQR